MDETEKMFELTQKTYELVEGIFGSYNNLNKLYENSIKDYDDQKNLLKEAFENAQKNLTEIEKIKDGTTATTNKIEAILKDQSLIIESVKEVQKSIDDFNTQLPLEKKDIDDIKTEIITKKKEIINSITSKIDELQNQKDDILRLIKSFSNVAINGVEATVASNGNIVHYKFQEGVSLEDVDFINEKADNGVDTLLGDKIENFSILSVQDGITLMDDKVVENGHMNASVALNAETIRLNSSMMEKSTDTDETDKNISSSFSLTPMDVSLEAKMIGLKSDGFSVSSGRVDFFTDSFYVSSKDSDGNIEAKKVLLEGDIAPQQMQNYLYTTNIKDLPPIRADLPSEYAVLSPLFWKYVNPYQTYTISTFGPQFYISASNSYSSCDHSIFMGDRDMGLGIVCSTPDEYSAGINIIEHRGPHTSSISVSSGITLTHSYSENAESPSVTQVRIDSDGFTVNGRNI